MLRLHLCKIIQYIGYKSNVHAQRLEKTTFLWLANPKEDWSVLNFSFYNLNASCSSSILNTVFKNILLQCRIPIIYEKLRLEL